MTRTELESIRDRLYVLACAVEDVERDVAAETPPAELREAFEWLLEAAKQTLQTPNAAPGL